MLFFVINEKNRASNVSPNKESLYYVFLFFDLSVVKFLSKDYFIFQFKRN